MDKERDGKVSVSCHSSGGAGGAPPYGMVQPEPASARLKALIKKARPKLKPRKRAGLVLGPVVRAFLRPLGPAVFVCSSSASRAGVRASRCVRSGARAAPPRPRN